MQKEPTIPTVIVKTGWEQVPNRPFIMKSNGRVYRYGLRYNVITDNDNKTELIDLRALPFARNFGTIEIIQVGKEEFVVVNGKEYSIPEILTTEVSGLG
jgi:hypothetical protein